MPTSHMVENVGTFSKKLSFKRTSSWNEHEEGHKTVAAQQQANGTLWEQMQILFKQNPHQVSAVQEQTQVLIQQNQHQIKTAQK